MLGCRATGTVCGRIVHVDVRNGGVVIVVCVRAVTADGRGVREGHAFNRDRPVPALYCQPQSFLQSARLPP
jgi:hypothetical protein